MNRKTKLLAGAAYVVQLLGELQQRLSALQLAEALDNVSGGDR